jgi:hypothetical protein
VKISVHFSPIALALIVMAVVSVSVMIVLTQIDFIVHRVLYDFGLLFSYRWAMPYWVSSGIIIGLSWFNLTASAALVYYFIKKRTPNAMNSQREVIEASSDVTIAIPDKEPLQTLDQFCRSEIKKYDVRHPAAVVDSQC